MFFSYSSADETPFVPFFASEAGTLHILTGQRGSGKTTWCQDLVAAAQSRGLSVGGTLSPAVIAEGQKVGIDLVILPDAQRRQLAKVRSQPLADTWSHHWQMDEDVLNWANAHLAQLTRPEVFIVDELGPLEFNAGRGLQAAFSLLDGRHYERAVVVIRSELLLRARQRWPWAQVISLTNGPTHD